jgi:integrase
LKYGEKYNKEYLGRLSVHANGNLITPQYVYRNYTRILKSQSDIPVIRFHDLRHTCAVLHIANGTDMKTLQLLLRHADFRTTANTYADSTMEIKREAMKNITLTHV